jgi:uncharacterized protein
MNNKANTHQLADIFECVRCGFCCHGETTVSLDERDQDQMVKALRLTREEVQERYWRVTGPMVQMQGRDGHCIFYDNNAGGTVHEGRPWRCRQWPLHPSMLADESNYRTITESCPGFKQQEISYEQFCSILQSVLNTSGSDKICG